MAAIERITGSRHHCCLAACPLRADDAEPTRGCPQAREANLRPVRTSPRPRDERRYPKVSGLPASRAFQNSDRQLALQNVVVETDTDDDKRKQPELPRRSGEAGADQGKRDLATGRADDRSHQYTDEALADDKARGDQYAPPTRTRAKVSKSAALAAARRRKARSISQPTKAPMAIVTVTVGGR